MSKGWSDPCWWRCFTAPIGIPAGIGLVAVLTLSGCGRHPSSNPPATFPSGGNSTNAGNSSRAPSPSGAPPTSGSSKSTARQLPPSVTPGEYVEEGNASWYGVPFNGRRTSNGEIYDMNTMTAAHRTLPFNSIIRVTNLATGQQTEVRINDRGPFVTGRIIDLSFAAAKAVGIWGPGVGMVRLEVVSGSDPYVGTFAVQVGAFRVKENAGRLQTKLAARYAPVLIQLYDSPTGVFYRVRVGSVPSIAAAQQLALQLQGEGYVPFVVRLDTTASISMENSQ
jgi:rare lipoprotein A